MAYIKANHPEIPSYPDIQTWTAVSPSQGVFRFTGSGWNVTMLVSIGIVPTYNMTVLYVGGTPLHQMVNWTGTYTGNPPTGTITERSYRNTP
jgi:hypothetical protein